MPAYAVDKNRGAQEWLEEFYSYVFLWSLVHEKFEEKSSCFRMATRVPRPPAAPCNAPRPAGSLSLIRFNCRLIRPQHGCRLVVPKHVHHGRPKNWGESQNSTGLLAFRSSKQRLLVFNFFSTCFHPNQKTDLPKFLRVCLFLHGI